MELLLGPIIGFTDSESTRIWVRASGNVERLRARVEIGHITRLFRFESTEATIWPGERIFNTGVCTVRGLKPGIRYRFDVVEAGPFSRTLTSGTVRTPPPPNSRADVTIVSTSCSGGTGDLDESNTSPSPVLTGAVISPILRAAPTTWRSPCKISRHFASQSRPLVQSAAVGPSLRSCGFA